MRILLQPKIPNRRRIIMPNKTNKDHENESMHMIPNIVYEYEKWKASRQKNRIVCALAVTNLAWFGLLLAYILLK